MPEYDNTNTFILFAQDVEEGSNKPSTSGTLNVEGKEYDIAGWSNTSKGGTRFIKGKLSPKKATASTKEEAPF